MDIYKIGGIVFRTPQGFESLKEVLNNQDNNTFIIVSAIGKTSRNLRSCINFAAVGKLEEAIDMVDSIIDLHESLADSILSESNRKAYDSFLHNRKNLLTEKLKGLSLIKDVSPSISDYILAEGENLALQ
jgi:aspartokinase